MVAVLVVLVGCGGAPDGTTTADGPADTATDAPTPDGGSATDGTATSDVTITAHEFSLDAPETLPAGEITFTLQNEGALPHNAQLVQIPGGSEEAFQDDGRYGTVMNQATWLGGPSTVGPQGTSPSVMTTLQPGTYGLLCLVETEGSNHASRGMRATFVVEGERTDPAEPAVDATVGLDEYEFDVPDGFTGAGRFAVDNQGAEDHEMSILRVPDAATVDDVREELLTWDGATPTPDTLAFAGGVQALRFRKSQLIDLDLDRGTYALVCFVPTDATQRTRHWQEGMLAVVDVP